jgi:hypothetical protein
MLCGPFEVPTVFQVTTHRRTLHDFALAPSIEISIRTTPSPFADPTISTLPVAGDGAATLTDTFDWANAGDALKTDPITDATTAKCLLHKAVSSQSGGPRSCL